MKKGWYPPMPRSEWQMRMIGYGILFAMGFLLFVGMMIGWLEVNGHLLYAATLCSGGGALLLTFTARKGYDYDDRK